MCETFRVKWLEVVVFIIAARDVKDGKSSPEFLSGPNILYKTFGYSYILRINRVMFTKIEGPFKRLPGPQCV